MKSLDLYYFHYKESQRWHCVVLTSQKPKVYPHIWVQDQNLIKSKRSIENGMVVNSVKSGAWIIQLRAQIIKLGAQIIKSRARIIKLRAQITKSRAWIIKSRAQIIK